jgi:hypothetical protein
MAFRGQGLRVRHRSRIDAMMVDMSAEEVRNTYVESSKCPDGPVVVNIPGASPRSRCHLYISSMFRFEMFKPVRVSRKCFHLVHRAVSVARRRPKPFSSDLLPMSIQFDLVG